MPKPPSFPILYDEVKTLSIAFLRKHGYLKPEQWKSGIVTWYRGDLKTGSVSISVTICNQESYLELEYKCDEKPIKYRVLLLSILSNIGKGIVWYFVCPYTGKKCRKLYLVDTFFYHRSAFSGCMYEKQTYSHKNRQFHLKFSRLFNTEDALNQINSKHFKSYYNNKATKRYKKLLNRVALSKL